VGRKQQSVTGKSKVAGHNSKPIHHAYSKRAEVTVPSLDGWEKQWQKNPQEMQKPKVVPVEFRAADDAGAKREAVAQEG
jgi:hypothetical protein